MLKCIIFKKQIINKQVKSINDFTNIIKKFNQELSISQLFVYIFSCIMGFKIIIILLLYWQNFQLWYFGFINQDL